MLTVIVWSEPITVNYSLVYLSFDDLDLRRLLWVSHLNADHRLTVLV